MDSHGLTGLFGLSFLAATLVPLGSEWLVALLVSKGAPMAAVVIVATAGNVLGSLSTYVIGLWGATRLIERWLRFDPPQMAKARTFFRRYGAWSLLMAWLPGIGDPLCLVAGSLRFSLVRFILLVATGKAFRYGLVAAAAHGMAG